MTVYDVVLVKFSVDAADFKIIANVSFSKYSHNHT